MTAKDKTRIAAAKVKKKKKLEEQQNTLRRTEKNQRHVTRTKNRSYIR
jgi:hypothetical protein